MSTDFAREAIEKIRSGNKGWIANTKDALGEFTVTVPASAVVAVCEKLKSEHGFDMLADLCGSDRGPEEEPRFEVNYHLFSTVHHNRVRVKVLLGEDSPKVDTVTTIWKTANWHERETYDLVGIIFEGHPDLRRILLPSDFDGHALRKDYPLRGYEPYSLT